MSFHIRRANQTDANQLATLGMQVWLHTYAWAGISATIARYAQEEFSSASMLHRLSAPELVCLVAESADAENLLGYAVVNFSAPLQDIACQLQTLYVQEHQKGIGIGFQLLQASRQLVAETNGASGLWLMVNAQNQAAQDFYLRQSFAYVGERDFMLEGVAHKNWLMADQLSSD